MRIVTVAAVLLAATTAFAAPPAGQAPAAPAAPSGPDYSTLPPEPTEVQKQLSGAKISLPQAVDAAEKAMGAQALIARANIAPEGTVAYEVIVTSGGIQKRVVVDGATGKVTGATVTLKSAIDKALEATKGGMVKDTMMNLGAEPPVINVMVYKDGQRHDVVVNAVDGAIVSDTPMPRLPGEAFTGEIKTTPSGLMYVDLKEGTGATPADKNAVVRVHYTGWFTDGRKFDSSVDRGQPLDIGLSGVIPGWTEGVGSMKVGGKRKLIVPYTLGYGPQGRGNMIPPKAMLIFDVELLDIPNKPQQ
jgi:peptidylprolyl isomerase